MPHVQTDEINKPCEYCGAKLPLGTDKRTRRIRSAHFKTCEKKPAPSSMTWATEVETMRDLLLRAEDYIEALDGTSVENEKLVDDYRAWRTGQ